MHFQYAKKERITQTGSSCLAFLAVCIEREPPLKLHYNGLIQY